MKIGLAGIGIILVALGIYANAAELGGSCSASVTQCELAINSLELCNDSDETRTYDSSLTSKVIEWFQVIPSQVTLKAGECTDLSVFTIAPCYASPAKYNADLAIKSGSSKVTKTCFLDLKQGHSVDVEVSPPSQSASQCEEKTYGVRLTNNTAVPNQKSEGVDLSVSGIPENWFILEEKKLSVEKGQTRAVRLKVRAPCDANFGNYEFKVRAALQNPSFFKETKATHTITQGQKADFIFPVEAQKGIEACTEQNTSLELKIANNGKLADKFKVSVEGASFVRLDKDSVSVGTGKEAALKLILDTANQKPGKYKLKVKAASQLFDYSNVQDLSLELLDCYGAEVKALGKEKACSEETPEYRFKVKNTQARALELKASLTGIKGELSANTIKLEPGKEADFSAVLDVKNLAKEGGKEKNSVKFTVKLLSEHYKYEKDFLLEVYDCHNALLQLPELELCRGIEKTENLVIENLGTEKQEFKLAYLPNWVKGTESVKVEGGRKQEAKITVATPAEAGSEKLSVKAVSKELLVEGERKITFLPDSTCFGINLSLSTPQLDVMPGEAKKYSLLIENKGVTKQEVGLKASQPFVYIAPETVSIDAGAKREVEFLVSPPLDVSPTAEISFDAHTDRGFKASTKTKLVLKPREATAPKTGEQAVKKDENAAKAMDENRAKKTADENKGTEKGREEKQTQTGLLNIADISTGVLAGLVVLVIILIAFSAYNAVQQEMKKVEGQAPEMKEATEQTIYKEEARKSRKKKARK